MNTRIPVFALVALALLCGIVFPAASCASFGQDCITTSCCPGTGLVCDTFTTPLGATIHRCNQPLGICTEQAPDWKQTITDSNLHGEGSLEYAVTQVEQGGPDSIIKSSSGIYRWFYDWKAAGFVGVMISVVIIALAAMVGHAFNLPEVKAFVDTELMQAVVSVLLIVGLMGLIVFFDFVAQTYLIEADLPVSCTNPPITVPCYIHVAKTYLTEIYDFGQTHAQEQLVKTVRLMAFSTVGNQFQFNKWWAAFAGTNFRASAGLSIEAERAGLVFNATSGLLASIYAQRYFIDVISFGIAPVLLLLGILLRTFFFTRKLGGLLLAIALGLFLVYPLTYAFSWYTLNIQIYGERVSANEVDCPSECTLGVPVAFYVNSTGGLVNFPTTQSLKQAGIDASNWETGGPGGEYPGFVSCIPDMFGTGNPPNACPDCPSYCREVPFPSQYSECDFVACSACNPGCKVYRTRTDCYKKSVCDPTKCQPDCRTTVPYENRCYVDYVTGSNGIIPATTVESADFGNDCSGCDGCPTWCKIRKPSATGGTEPAYSDSECQVNACKSPTQPGGTCPDACVYVSPIGATNRCEPLCTKNGITCPAECRFNPSSIDLSKYDVEDFYPSYCQSVTYNAACTDCPNVCKTLIPPDPRNQPAPVCYPYPQNNYKASECTDCPNYCRFSDFAFIPDSPISNNPKTGGVPDSCIDSRIKCSSSTTPSECAGSCKTTAPPICIAFHSYKDQLSYTYPAVYCNQCPVNARVKLLTHINKNGVPDAPVAPAIPFGYCASAACADSCKLDSVALKTEIGSGGTCKDFDSAEYILNKPRDSYSKKCAVCPYDCRVSGISSEQDAKCNKDVYDDIGSLRTGTVCDATYCPDTCKAGTPGYTCKAYIGAGSQCGYTVYWQDGDPECGLAMTQTDCVRINLAYVNNRCKWKMEACYGPSTPSLDCNAFDKPGCLSHITDGCKWLTSGDERIPIDQRGGATADREACALCPENCRLGTSNYDCYVKDNKLDGASNAYIDCSIAKCKEICRVPVPPVVLTPTPPATDVCKEFIPFDLPCLGTPALCRKAPESMPPDPPFCQSYPVCSGDCIAANPPTEACSGCYECEYDCIYNPAVRTDCGDVCSDEALQGPVNIGPSDFHKKLPGAAGATDVKNTGTLLVLGLVLPIFNIVLVISFIRVLSPVLGGDIEIPGLGKII